MAGMPKRSTPDRTASRAGAVSSVSDNSPPHDFPAELVNDRCQIHMATLRFDVGDINRPDLIWEANSFIS